jgi:hypothetical protein
LAERVLKIRRMRRMRRRGRAKAKIVCNSGFYFIWVFLR